MSRGRGRKGRRSKEMIQVANQRIEYLFNSASEAAVKGDLDLSHRYASLAMAIATRYNVRLENEHKAHYCRKCRSYMLDGTSSRTRVKSGRIIRTCLKCGSVRRLPLIEKQ